jgi:hypothetical protein
MLGDRVVVEPSRLGGPAYGRGDPTAPDPPRRGRADGEQRVGRRGEREHGKARERGDREGDRAARAGEREGERAARAEERDRERGERGARGRARGEREESGWAARANDRDRRGRLSPVIVSNETVASLDVARLNLTEDEHAPAPEPHRRRGFLPLAIVLLISFVLGVVVAVLVATF